MLQRPDSGESRRERVAWLLHRVRSAPPKRCVLRDVADGLTSLLGAEQALALSVSRDADRWSVSGLAHPGFDDDAARVWRDCVAAAPRSGWGTFDAEHPAPAERNRARLLRGLRARPELAQLPIWRAMRASGVAGKDSVRAIVCDGGRLLAWVAAFRTEPFSADDLQVLDAVAPHLVEPLRAQEHGERSEVALAALAPALEQIPAPAAVISTREGVLFANAAGRELLRCGALRACLDDPGYEKKRLLSSGGDEHWLVVHRSADASRLQRFGRAAAEWRLTPRQREVFEAMVDGSTNRDIATRLGCGVRTVEIHVAAVLEKSGCESRCELTARFWSAPA